MLYTMLGGFLAVDHRAGWQGLLAQPVFAAAVIGFIVGEVEIALAVGAVGIFTINFWTVLWKFAQWVDENLTVAMHPGSLDGLMNWAASPGGFAGATSKALMLDTMLAMFMIGMPVLWTMMMGWIGIKVGAGMRDVLSDGSAAAKRSVETGSKVASKSRWAGLTEKSVVYFPVARVGARCGFAVSTITISNVPFELNVT